MFLCKHLEDRNETLGIFLPSWPFPSANKFVNPRILTVMFNIHSPVSWMWSGGCSGGSSQMSLSSVWYQLCDCRMWLTAKDFSSMCWNSTNPVGVSNLIEPHRLFSSVLVAIPENPAASSKNDKTLNSP